MGGDGQAITHKDKRVLLICIDSMSLAFARAHLNLLPTLQSMIDEGALIELESPARYVSACVWPTFATGVDAGEHGHYYPFQWDPERMQFWRTAKPGWSTRLAFDPFWHRFARAGVETTVLDSGYVVHEEHTPWRQITNWSYQSSGAAWASDPALLRDIRRRFGYRPIGMEAPVPKTLGQSRRIRNDLLTAVRRKADAVLWLMEQSAWRFFLAGFYEIHRAGHNLLLADGDFGSDVDPDALLDVYAENDRQLGRIIRKAANEDTTVIVCSLHSMKPNYAQDHFLQEIMARLNTRHLETLGTPRPPRRSGNLVSFLRERVPYRLQYGVAQLLGEDVQDALVNRGLVGGLDWASTPAIRAASGGEGYIRLSIKGRESRGFFEPDSAALQQYKAWLKKQLLDIKVAGSDEPLIAAVCDTDDLFPGPRRDLLPDFILEWGPAAPAEQIYSPAIGTITAHLATGRGGNHSGEGFMAVIGPGAKDRAISEVRHIRDIARFVEAQFGFSVSRSPA